MDTSKYILIDRPFCTENCLTQEIWHVVTYNNFYEISSCGRIRSARTSRRAPCGYILKPHSDDTYRYLSIALHDSNKKRRTCFIHDLVAAAFIGQRPENYQIDHIDGEIQNNHMMNLRYCTPKQNSEFTAQRGSLKGTRNGQARLDENAIYSIREARANGEILTVIAARHGITFQTVSDISRRKRWGWLP